MKYIYNNPERKSLRKKLRSDSSYIEAVLWKHLQNRQRCGFKFRRQYSIGPYVVDFYCPQQRLAVELDGQQHFECIDAILLDGSRQEYIESVGVRVLRYSSVEVMRNITGVVEDIDKHLMV